MARGLNLMPAGGTATLTQSPFAVLTLIVAPAVLTNATSVLAMSTINRMLRTRDRMHDLFSTSEQGGLRPDQSSRLLAQVARVEKQGSLLLGALRFIYVSLSAFASAALMTLIGASLAGSQGDLWFRVLGSIGLALGFIAVGGLVAGCLNLLRATRISLQNIQDEAGMIRERQKTPS
jgi:hypothetical protein